MGLRSIFSSRRSNEFEMRTTAHCAPVHKSWHASRGRGNEFDGNEVSFVKRVWWRISSFTKINNSKLKAVNAKKSKTRWRTCGEINCNRRTKGIPSWVISREGRSQLERFAKVKVNHRARHREKGVSGWIWFGQVAGWSSLSFFGWRFHVQKVHRVLSNGFFWNFYIKIFKTFKNFKSQSTAYLSFCWWMCSGTRAVGVIHRRRKGHSTLTFEFYGRWTLISQKACEWCPTWSNVAGPLIPLIFNIRLNHNHHNIRWEMSEKVKDSRLETANKSD